MHRHHSIAIAAVLLAVTSAWSCSSCGLTQCDREKKGWVLTCVEIDRSQLCNTGSLPVYRKTDGYAFGSEPVAMGAMQASRDGLWTVNVKFRETVVGFGGRKGTHEYDVIQLAGKADSTGQCIRAQGAIPSDVMTGVATQVHVTKISDTKLKVQPATNNKKLPYIFTFDCSPPQPRPVAIPLL